MLRGTVWVAAGDAASSALVEGSAAGLAAFGDASVLRLRFSSASFSRCDGLSAVSEILLLGVASRAFGLSSISSANLHRQLEGEKVAEQSAVLAAP